MHLPKTQAALVGLLALILAGCSDTPVTIDGFAATGAALSNAKVTARCTSGPEISATTDSAGLFQLSIGNGQVMPCLVRVAGEGTTLHSFAETSGRLNVTPLTEISIGKALGSDPSTAFAAFDGTKSSAIAQGLAGAKASIRSQIELLTGQMITGDLFTSTFKVGDPDDRVLDTLRLKLVAAGQTLSQVVASASAGSALFPPAGAADRGLLVSPPEVVAELSQQIMSLLVTEAKAEALVGTPRCGVKVVGLHYRTAGVIGEKATASAAMLVPVGCTPNGALIAHAKGTDVVKTRTLADANDNETRLLMMMYAAQGYTVIATDYLGFAKSSYSYHPYLHADTQAASIIDSIRAAKLTAPSVGAALSGPVMLTGYSQGGHASMAAHRTIEKEHAAEINVVAGAHLAGPYFLSGALQSGAAIAGYQFFVPYVVTSYQKVYGDLYGKAADAFKSPYSEWIDSLLPSATLNYTSLITQGKLPSTQLAPTQVRDALLQPSFLAQASIAESPLLKAARKNDLLGWNPVAPVMLCGGAGDPTIPPALFQAPMVADFASRGISVTSVDVDPTVRALYGQQLASDPLTYFGNYHGTYAPPLCHQAARQFFSARLASR